MALVMGVMGAVRLEVGGGADYIGFVVYSGLSSG